MGEGAAIQSRRALVPCSSNRFPFGRLFSGTKPNPAFSKVNGRAHNGKGWEGTFLYTLTLTDVATGWTNVSQS